MSNLEDTRERQSWLDRPIFSFFPILNGELLIFLLILILAAISRFYNLGERVMSHDENLHTYFSWLFSQGKGYEHTPLMHGPLLFHLTALAYEIFGSSDFISRFPQALSSLLTVILLWKWRRYLGRAGTLVAAALMVISPFMLYYARYARNEAFVALFGVLTLYAILRYFETGKISYLFLLTAATALHFSSKETAFIYTAQAMLFLAAYLINRLIHLPWKRDGRLFNSFIIAISIGILLVGAALGLSIYNRTQVTTSATQTAAPLLPGQAPETAAHLSQLSPVTALAFFAGLAFLVAAVLLILGYGWQNLRRERSLAMLVLLGTFVLPMLAAFPVTALGGDPLAYQFTWPGWDLRALWTQQPVRTGVVFLILTVLSILIGILWDGKRWIGLAGLFWGIYIVLFTSVFSNWQGFFTGSVGSLGYWLVQQGVHRGGQPWYYYLLIQIPIYEFLPALGLWLAVILGLRKRSAVAPISEGAPTQAINASDDPSAEGTTPSSPGADPISEGNYTLPLLLWWAFSSVLAYSLAGEKMPWLSVHITLPMILLTGWAIGQLIERIDWSGFRESRRIFAALLWTVLLLSLAEALVMALGANPPFQGKTLQQLTGTGIFLFMILMVLASASGLIYLRPGWEWRQNVGVASLIFFGLLAGLTARTAFRAAYVNFDNGTEYLVYAHGATGIKDVMDQVTTISSRIAGEKNLKVAYDNNLPKQGLSWSFKWYLRNYPNAVSFDQPDDSLKDFPVILVDVNNFAKIKPIVGENYYQETFVRMVWPNQDYFSLTWPRIKEALTNRALRDAIFQIWLNRDYSAYARVTGEAGLTLTDWQPSDKMELFIRKDIAAQIWDYGIKQPVVASTDPYEKGTISLSADLVFGNGTELNAPRGVAVTSDGSLLVADSRNNRIQHYDPNGKLLNTWGETSPGCPYAQVPPADVPLGTFCEPWAVAASPDGKWVYVADTWNHRIQKLTSDGKPVKAWGTPNYDPVSSGPTGLWGPRGIAVDSSGRVLVADTGNKRIIIYDADGNFLFQFGGGGISPGQLEEPVGLAFNPEGTLYVADTWNQRIQSFSPNSDRTAYSPVNQWTIAGWNSESLDNKPYLAVDQKGDIFATDPDGFRVLEFSGKGDFIRAWGNYGTGPDNFGLPSGIAVDAQGRVWVSDSANNRIMRFTLP